MDSYSPYITHEYIYLHARHSIFVSEITQKDTNVRKFRNQKQKKRLVN